MKYCYLITTAALLCFFSCIKAQRVVNTTGNTISSPDFYLEYSIGEIGITTIADPASPKAFYITQGVLQPILKVDADCNIINDTLAFFPNPTRNFLSVVPKYNWITSYRIYAADGKLVRASFFVNNQINLQDLAAGVYFIKILPGCNNKYRILKVIKQ